MIRPDDGYEPKEYTFCRLDKEPRGPFHPVYLFLTAMVLGAILIAGFLFAVTVIFPGWH